MTDEQLDRYSAQLADVVIVSIRDPATAAGVLMQAAVFILIAGVPGASSMAALEHLVSSTVEGFRDVLEPKGTVQ